MITTKYRARKEWFGYELFDRIDGRVIPLDQVQSERIASLQSSGVRKELMNRVLLPGLFNDHEIAIEYPVDTPYAKTREFASAPRRIYWELTRLCNLNCRACFNRFFPDRNELAGAEILSIAEHLYAAGVYEIRCTGGEPTMRPDFFELAEELARMGFYLSMGSNGCYSDKTLKKVIDAPLDWIILSIDGSDEQTFAESRGRNIYGTVLNTLEAVADAGKRIRVNTLVRKNNYTYAHLKGLAELCDRFGVESLNCIPLRPVFNDPGMHSMQLSRAEFREFIQGLNALRQEHRVDFVTTLDLRHTIEHDRVYYKDKSCAAGREGAVLSPYGELYGCSYSLASDPGAPQEKRRRYVAGNLLEEDFLAIWNDSARWAIYRDLDRYKHDTCKACAYYSAKKCIGNCPIMDKENPDSFDPYCYLFID